MTRLLPRRALSAAASGCVLATSVVAACTLALSPASAASQAFAKSAGTTGTPTRTPRLAAPSGGSVLLDETFTGSVVPDRPLPGNGGLQVTFRQSQYGGSGADGIGFFLVDGNTDLTSAGADGGSLGYAQRGDQPGVGGGYIGVGLDAFGNYANDAENRGNGCAAPEVSPVPGGGQVPDSVVLRGPGQGLTGYCYLAGTLTPDPSKPSGWATTLPGTLRANGTDPAASERTVRVTVSPDQLPMVTVEIDFEDGAGFRTVLTHRMTEQAPPTYKFGFSSSTGGSTDTHPIRDVVASSLVTLDRLNLVKTVADPAGTTYSAGDKVNYQFLVTNTGTTELTNVTVADPSVADIACPRDTLGSAGSPTASMVCTGSHTVTVADSQGGQFTNAAQAHARSGDTDVPSNSSTAQVPVVAVAPKLVLDKTAEPRRVRPGGKVSYTLTVTNRSEFDVDTAEASDDLTDVLAHTSYDNDVTASAGSVTVAGNQLLWSGTLADGVTATIRYSVTVDSAARPGQTLADSVTSDVVGAECAGGGALPCPAEVTVVPDKPEPPTPPNPPHHPGYGDGLLAATGVVAFVPVGAVAVAAMTFGFVLCRRARTR